MKKSRFCITAAAAFAAVVNCASAQTTDITWETLGNDASTYTQRLTVTGPMDFARLAFNMLPRTITPANPADTIIELMPGYYALSSPRFRAGADTVVVDIVTSGAFTNCSYAIDGIHRVETDGTTSPVVFHRMPITQPQQWQSEKFGDRMPYADTYYDINERISGGQAGVYDVIPSYKEIVYTGGIVPDNFIPSIKIMIESPESVSRHPMRPGEYFIEIGPDGITVTAADTITANAALGSFAEQVLRPALATPGTILPCASIHDWPDYEYRGLMIDVCRNFQPIDELKRVVDLMARYRMNRLHLHAVDDEAWRIEIPALPELTEYAGRRGYSTDESEYLLQAYSGDGNPESRLGASNGYYTRDEFIDFLRYAASKGVLVIPEIESPGHARAAVKAMEKRYRDTGDDTYRLIHDGDTSEYTSAQSYHDNVMNPALEGPYRFLDVVLDAVKDMYSQAGVPLLAIHIGGDEVARGAWDGSEAARTLIREKNLAGQTGLHGYFVDRIASMLQEKGIPMSGWQEIAVGHTPEYNAEMAPLTFSVNCWTQSNPDPQKSITARAIRAGFPTVISNVNHFYLDMCYSYHPEEPGLTWGGIVDEFQSLHGYPAELCPLDPAGEKGDIIGLSGHLFAETLRSPEMLEMYILPKMLGLAERAWNATETYDDADYNAVVSREMQSWDYDRINFHLRQPGIKKIDGRILMNSPYEGAEIRYTTDGTEPDANSTLYTAPLELPAGVSEIRARLYHLGKESVTSLLLLQE